MAINLSADGDDEKVGYGKISEQGRNCASMELSQEQ